MKKIYLKHLLIHELKNEKRTYQIRGIILSYKEETLFKYAHTFLKRKYAFN